LTNTKFLSIYNQILSWSKAVLAMLEKRNVSVKKIIEPDGFRRASKNWGFRTYRAEIAAYTTKDGFVPSNPRPIRLSKNPHLINHHYPSRSMSLTVYHNCRSQLEN